MANGNTTVPRGRLNSSVHIRSDSESKMDELFRVLKDPVNKQLPFSKRNFPASFFQPPEPRSDRGSNENFSVVKGHLSTQAGTLPVLHARSLSSPAQLPHSLSAAPQLQTHVKQTSISGNFEELTLNEQPFPVGWESATTSEGIVYYIK